MKGNSRVVGELIGVVEGFIEHRTEVASQVIDQGTTLLVPGKLLEGRENTATV